MFGACDSIIEQKFGKLGNEILEELYVNEVMDALEYCMGVVTEV